ncbi:MAG: TIGR03936 family radical SAM-associated protein [Oscillospiraceae bacterium]|nr:TIGR03936 family radical SAM-associated protein [Oscillospiraceae bacterium]
MDKIRMKYSKLGRAKYISHLDLVTTLQRALLRAGVKLKYSEGFNPHPYISVALPMSVGAESLCELADVEIHGGFPDNVNDYLPDGLEILGLYKPLRKFNAIKWVNVCCRLFYDDAVSDKTLDILKSQFSADTLVISKKTKRGVSDIDIAEFIKNAKVSLSGNNTVEVSVNISASQPTVSNNDILSIACFNAEIPKPSQLNVKRIEIFDKDMVLFK